MSHHVIATIFDKRGEVISTGENSYVKTHTTQAKYAKRLGLDDKIYLHAEIAAIIRCRGKKPHKILIERFSKLGLPLLAKPCIICELAIKEAGIKYVEYTC